MASTSTLEPSSAMVESPNWLELPHELMANILKRLGDAEILTGAVKVCTTWWRICKDPSMWKAINVHVLPWPRHADYDLGAVTKQAVHLSSGELIDISISGFGNDDLLDYIVLRSCKLNSLCLTNCHDITSQGLSRALKMVPQLEKLHISSTYWGKEFIKVIVPNCPQLKSFKYLDRPCSHLGIKYDDDGFTIANNMPELRHLQVFGYNMTHIGLQAILDGCPHLEVLDIRTCYNFKIDENEVKRSMERIKNFKFSICGVHSLAREIFLRSVDFEDEYYDQADDYDFDSDDDYPDYL